jgi:glycosyltransferase involved in cell wall biosynthesis
MSPAADRRGLVMVSRGDIFPADHGAAVAIDRLAWGLSRCFGPVFLVADHRRSYFAYEDGERRVLPYPSWLRLWLPRTLIEARLRLQGVPASEAFLYRPVYDWRPEQRALYVARRHGARLYQAAFPAFALPCLRCRRELGGAVVLVEHNVEYQRLAEQGSGLSAGGHRYLRALELDVCRTVDAVVTVSDRDRALLLADGIPPEQVHTIPHGVDLSAYDHARSLTLRSKLGVDERTRILVYHGIYSYEPNLQAMQLMADRILPALLAHGVPVKLLALGREPPARSPDPDIIFTGSVESVAPWLLAADLAVVPLTSGGGTRMKVLDYFAARLPVVSTSKGVEGIPVRDGEEFVLADEPERFAAAIARLLDRPEEARALAARGRAFVERLDWLAVARQHAALLESLEPQPPPGEPASGS